MKNPKWRCAYPGTHKVKFGGAYLTGWEGHKPPSPYTDLSNGGWIYGDFTTVSSNGYRLDSVNEIKAISWDSGTKYIKLSKTFNIPSDCINDNYILLKVPYGYQIWGFNTTLRDWYFLPSYLAVSLYRKQTYSAIDTTNNHISIKATSSQSTIVCPWRSTSMVVYIPSYTYNTLYNSNQSTLKYAEIQSNQSRTIMTRSNIYLLYDLNTYKLYYYWGNKLIEDLTLSYFTDTGTVISDFGTDNYYTVNLYAESNVGNGYYTGYRAEYYDEEPSIYNYNGEFELISYRGTP